MWVEQSRVDPVTKWVCSKKSFATLQLSLAECVLARMRRVGGDGECVATIQAIITNNSSAERGAFVIWTPGITITRLSQQID